MHGHLLQGETPPRCLACQVDLTVEHILLHCVNISQSDTFLIDQTNTKHELTKMNENKSIELNN